MLIQIIQPDSSSVVLAVGINADTGATEKFGLWMDAAKAFNDEQDELKRTLGEEDYESMTRTIYVILLFAVVLF